MLGGVAIREAIGTQIVALFVLGVAEIRDIDAADEAELAQTGGDGDQRAAIVALALAAKMLFGDLGRLAATGTADTEGQETSLKGASAEADPTSDPNSGPYVDQQSPRQGILLPNR